jgi:predicted phage terminase large subunit-like protein
VPAKAKAPDLDRQQQELIREAARQRLAVDTLAGFVRYLWSEIEPGRPLVWSWYLDALCAELEGLARGEAPDGTPYAADGGELVVCIPPGHAKSRLCSVMFPAWLWLHIPHLRLLTVANESGLASRDSRFSREIIKSEPFRALQLRLALDQGDAVIDNAATTATGTLVVRPTVDDGAGGRVAADDREWEPWGLEPDQAAKVNFETEGGGGRIALGINARVTGKRADALIVDDPHDAQEVIKGDPARVVERMREARTTYHGALLSRLNAGAWRLVVMQRLHVADLAGDLIDRGARVVCLPAHYDPKHPDAYQGDQREPGELLAPAVHPEKKDRALRQRLTPRHHDAQYEQRPSTEAGGNFKRAWFNQHYQASPLELCRVARFDEVAISVDCSFRDNRDSDYVVAQVWGRKRGKRSILFGKAVPEQMGKKIGGKGGVAPGKYLLDQRRDRMTLHDTCAMLRRLRAKWPWARLVLVEAKANGDAVIETLRREGHGGVVGFEPDRSKAARAEVSALSYEAGEVFLPTEDHAPWLGDYVEEHVQFPAGANDDQVDSTSQMHCRWAMVEADDIAGELSWVNHL